MNRPLLLLLVEDDPALQALVTGLVGKFSATTRVEVAGTLADALGRLGAEPPVNAVLLDLELPDSSGLDTLRAVLAARRLPVVVLTGGGESLEGRALACGAEDYLFKEELSGPALVRSVRHAVIRHEFRPVREAVAAARETVDCIEQASRESGS